MKGFIVYSTYELIKEKTIVQLFGRLENGESFVCQFPSKQYFFIKEKEEKKVSKYLKKYIVEKTNFTNFHNEKVIKISHENHIELNKLHKTIHKTVDTYEADIKPQYRFLIDNNLLGNINIEGDYIKSEKVDRIYNSPEVQSPKSDFTPKLKILSMDTESDSKGNLFCIGLHTEKYKKVFFITKHELKNAVSCKDEADCLQKVKEEIIKLDPDIITGWNFIDHDLKYLQSLYQKHKIPFDIGRTNDNIRLRIESSFFRSSSADVPGRQIIDALYFIRDPFIKEAPTIKFANFESYTLEDVSQALLNEGKLIKGKDRHTEIESLYKSNSQSQQQKLADYNLLDTELVYKILEKTKMIDLAIERSQLIGMPLDRITASIASFDSLYIREAHSRNLVSPTSVFVQKEERIKGGYVKESIPGIYYNVLIFDFKSLYPSIMRTFNIDPASFREKKEKNTLETVNKAYFINQSGILPQILEKLHKAREKAKQEKRELSSYAIKIIMNSFFGVLASPNCRYFSLKMANAITHTGQFIIKLTAEEIEKKFKTPIIYSDTDSVFVDTELSKEKANSLGREIESEINNFYKNYIKKNYSRESILELQFEKQYLAMMIPKIRGDSEAGAKKRYAGLIEKDGKEKIEIIGLEAIRGDWTEAAKEFQRELLRKAFKKEPIEQFIKEYIKKIEEGKLDEKLVYKKSIRKGLADYTKTTPPHVKAARKLDKLDSNIIKYYITIDGPEPIQKLKHKIDYQHYIEKQIKPIAEQVLSLVNKQFEDIQAGSKQQKLF